MVAIPAKWQRKTSLYLGKSALPRRRLKSCDTRTSEGKDMDMSQEIIGYMEQKCRIIKKELKIGLVTPFCLVFASLCLHANDTFITTVSIYICVYIYIYIFIHSFVYLFIYYVGDIHVDWMVHVIFTYRYQYQWYVLW